MFNSEVCFLWDARDIKELKSPLTTKPPILFGCLALEVYTRIANIVRHLWCGLLVMVPKTKAGVATDANGYYKINLAAGEAFLQYMYVDYPTLTVSVDKANMDDVVMDKNALPNTVVVKDVSTPSDPAAGKPLCVIKKSNGKLYVGDMKSISPDDIKTMHVFKGGEQLETYKKYGDTSNGVILIELK